MPPSYKNFITDAFGRFSQSDSAKTRWETANNLILMIDDNHYTIRADGTFDGQFGGKPMTGHGNGSASFGVDNLRHIPRTMIAKFGWPMAINSRS